MRILTIHNTYRLAGGEDLVFEAESRLLAHHGHEVEQMLFNNSSLNSTAGKLSAGLSLLYNRQIAVKLEEKLRSFKPHILHVHNFFPIASPSVFFVAYKLDIPVVVTLHNFRLICPGALLFHNQKVYERSVHSLFPLDAIIKGVYRDSRLLTASVAFCFFLHNVLGTWNSKVTRFIVLSDFAKAKFKSSRLRVDFNRMDVKPNFVEDQGYAASERENSFLFVGRLSEEKGVRTLLRAAKGCKFKLAIAGDGPLRDLVLGCCRDYPNVSYLGFLSKADVRRQMVTCTALISPSLCFEGFPLTIIEAFSAGTPVIASRIGSVAEIVKDNHTGLLFHPDDEVDLVGKITLLGSNPALAKSLGLNARSIYLAKYTPDMNYHMLMNVYKKALKESSLEDHVRKTSAPADTPFMGTLRDESPVPKLTVGIPTYNGGARILRALNSVFSQRYENLEIIISDNASTDNTRTVCSRVMSDHPEMRYFRQSNNIGLVENFDFVLSHARGKYFMWLSDDDTLEPGILDKCVSFLEKHLNVALVSGQIVYWKGEELDYIEKGFNFTSRFAAVRVLQYYGRALYGGMFHGVMRRDLASRIPARNVFGNDIHFVASLGYLGTIRNFDFPGYNKSLGGFSKDVHQCARALGESAMASRFPRVKIAVDAFAEVMYRSPVFTMPFLQRFSVAVLCFTTALTGYYGRIAPLTIGGKVKRSVYRLFNIRVAGSLFKHASFAHKGMKVVK